MGILLRLRPHRQIVVVEMLAMMGEWLTCPGLEDDLKALRRPCLAIGHINPERLVVVHDESAANAQFHPAAGHQVHHGHLLGDLDRVVQRHDDDRSPQPHALRPLRQGRQEQRRRRDVPAVGMEVVLVGPQRIEAEIFAGHHEVDQMAHVVAHAGIHVLVVRGQAEVSEFQKARPFWRCRWCEDSKRYE